MYMDTYGRLVLIVHRLYDSVIESFVSLIHCPGSHPGARGSFARGDGRERRVAGGGGELGEAGV